MVFVGERNVLSSVARRRWQVSRFALSMFADDMTPAAGSNGTMACWQFMRIHEFGSDECQQSPACFDTFGRMLDSLWKEYSESLWNFSQIELAKVVGDPLKTPRPQAAGSLHAFYPIHHDFLDSHSTCGTRVRRRWSPCADSARGEIHRGTAGQQLHVDGVGRSAVGDSIFHGRHA